MSFDRIFCTNGEIVKDTESHGPIPEGMMAWRSNQSKSITDFSLYDRSNSLHDPSRCHPSGLVRLGRGNGVRIKPDLGLFSTV